MIRVRDLTKVYRIARPKEGRFAALRSLIRPDYVEKRAVDGISFTIPDGEIVGYIGQNGAGKSTTIKMLSGILTPTSGTVEVGGLVPQRDRREHLQRIGVVFDQKTSLWWDVPVLDSLRVLKEIYRVDDPVCPGPRRRRTASFPHGYLCHADGAEHGPVPHEFLDEPAGCFPAQWGQYCTAHRTL